MGRLLPSAGTGVVVGELVLAVSIGDADGLNEQMAIHISG